MERKELIKKYIEFFKSKDHKEIPNVSLIPENDPTVLFTTAGMHPLVPYLLGEKHPQGKKLVNVQRCIRTGDIDEVGDTTHHTFFEMLGNWSLGDYFKKEAIEYSFEFLTKTLKIPKEKLAVTVFAGDKDAPKDEESAEIWKSLGIEKISFLGKKDNWWGPAGTTGPCGPDTEIFVNDVEIWNDVLMQYNKDTKIILVDGMHCLYDKDFRIDKELLELIDSFNTWNMLVVNSFRERGYSLVDKSNWASFSLEKEGIKKDNPEYFKRLLKDRSLTPEEVMYFDHDKKSVETAKKLGIISKHYTDTRSMKKFISDNLSVYLPAKQKNIDTGMGVERTIAILNNLEDNYLTLMWKPIIQEIEKLSNKKYKGNEREMRIIADHLKASVFIIADGTTPSNTEQGYVLRRLIRRAIVKLREMGHFGTNLTKSIAKKVFEIYDDYEHLQKNEKQILTELEKEEEKFEKTLGRGLRQMNKMASKKTISGKNTFLLFQSYGFPIEITKEIAIKDGVDVDEKGFQEEFEKHQKLSRTASAGKFKSGLADNSEATTRLHTAAHLLNEALRVVLKNPDLHQKGSNITPERLRFDFNFDRKLTDNERQAIEDLVNKKIQENIPVTMEEMILDKAKSVGAHGVFDSKYGDKVKVYSIGDFSKEICAGPHVDNVSQLGHFKITKEQSSSSGVRRIKAILE